MVCFTNTSDMAVNSFMVLKWCGNDCIDTLCCRCCCRVFFYHIVSMLFFFSFCFVQRYSGVHAYYKYTCLHSLLGVELCFSVLKIQVRAQHLFVCLLNLARPELKLSPKITDVVESHCGLLGCLPATLSPHVCTVVEAQSHARDAEC